ncbi:MAG: hypothetical protein ACTSXK_16185 [Promethearchaeota archaeon]
MDKITTVFLILMIVFIVLVLISIWIINHLRLKVKESKGYNANYPSSYICLDGHKVRSLSECLIDDFFTRNGIIHKYEDVILKTTGKKFMYDWYLKEADIYVEFFGFSGKKYKETREEKTNFYRRNNLKMIALEPDVLSNIEVKLPEKFGKIWKEIIHEKHCPNCGSALDSRI